MDISLVTTSLGAAFCFASALVLTKFGLRTTSPLVGASIALPTAAILFLIVSSQTVRWDQWNSGSAMIFAAVGLVFPVAVTLLTFHANQKIGPNLAGSLGNLTPFFAISFAVLLLGETPSNAQWIGIATISVGVTLLFLNDPEENQQLTLLTLGLPIVAAMLRGGVQPFVKLGLANWSSPLAAVTIGYVISALVISGFIFIRQGNQGLPDRVGLAWFTTVGAVNGTAVLLLYIALDNGPVTIVAPIVACYPLLTLVLNRFFLKDSHLNLSVFVGILLTVMGIGFLLSS